MSNLTEKLQQKLDHINKCKLVYNAAVEKFNRTNSNLVIVLSNKYEKLQQTKFEQTSVLDFLRFCKQLVNVYSCKIQ